MHEVHTFVSSCPGIDATTAAELLNHLLESMPLNEGGFPDLIADALADPTPGPWPGGAALVPAAEPSLGLAPPASAPSPSPSEETCSDSDEAEAEPGQTSTDGLDASQTHSLPSPSLPKSMWRPWTLLPASPIHPVWIQLQNYHDEELVTHLSRHWAIPALPVLTIFSFVMVTAHGDTQI
ncbi:transcription cofactor HES-6-like protein [Columba livia]|nr:transcription cofactor HES-6-like protein [Columba livia]